MKQIRIVPLRMAAAIALSTAFLAGAAANVWANPPGANGPAREEMRQEWTKHRQEWIHARLAKAANRLEIKASQQEAWQAFAKVVEQPIDLPAQKPDAPKDAATMTRWHADMAAAHAKKATQIADATAKLQEVLTPEQRKTFDQIVQRVAQHGRHGMNMHRGNWRGEGHMGMGPHHMDGAGRQQHGNW